MLQLSFVMHYPALHCIVKGSCRMLSSWGRRVRDSKGVDPWHIAIADDSHKSATDVLLYAATLLPCRAKGHRLHGVHGRAGRICVPSPALYIDRQLWMINQAAFTGQSKVRV